MTSLWRRTTSERQTLSDVPGLAAKKLRNTLSGGFLAKLGPRGKETPQGSADFTIPAYPDPETRAQPALPAQLPEQASENDAKADSTAEQSAGPTDVNSWLSASDVQLNDSASPAEDGKAAAQAGLSEEPPSPQQQTDQAAALKLGTTRPSNDSYAEELVQFLESSPNEKADTLVKLRSLKVQELENSRQLQRGVSYADEALDSMTASLNLETGQDQDVKRHAMTQNPLPAADAASISSNGLGAAEMVAAPPQDLSNNSFPTQPDRSEAEADVNFASAVDPVKRTLASVPSTVQGAAFSGKDDSEAGPTPDDIFPTAMGPGLDQLRQDVQGKSLRREASSKNMIADDQQPVLLRGSSSLQEARQLKRGESYADELLGNLTSEATSATNESPPTQSSRSNQPYIKQEAGSTGSAESPNMQPADGNLSRMSSRKASMLKRGESYADELASSLTSEASKASSGPQGKSTADSAPQAETNSITLISGGSSQPAENLKDASRSLSLQTSTKLRRGISYADDIMATLSSETSSGLADDNGGASASNEIQSESAPTAVSEIVYADSSARDVTVVMPAAANQVELATTTPGAREATATEPPKLSFKRAPSRQPSGRVLQRGESYADEMLDSLLAENDSNSVEDIRSHRNLAGLPTIMEGEQIAAQSPARPEAMAVPEGESWRETGRPPSRHGSQELQLDSVNEAAAVTPAADLNLSELDQDAPATEPQTSLGAGFPQQTASGPPAELQATWPAEDRPTIIDNVMPSQEEVPPSILPDEPAAGLLAGFGSVGALGADEIRTQAEVLSLSQDDEEPEVLLEASAPALGDQQVSSQPSAWKDTGLGEPATHPGGRSMPAETDAAALTGPVMVKDLSSAETSIEPGSNPQAPKLDNAFADDVPPEAKEDRSEAAGKTPQDDSGQAEGQSKFLPGIADAADQQSRVLQARLSRSLSATGKAAKILHKTAAYVRRTASITRSIPILPSQQSQMQQQQQDDQLPENKGSDSVFSSSSAREDPADSMNGAAMQADGISPQGDSSLPDSDRYRAQFQQVAAALRDDPSRWLAKDGQEPQMPRGQNPPEDDAGSVDPESELIKLVADGNVMENPPSRRAGQDNDDQSAQPLRSQPAYIDDDALPALQSPAVTSPSPPQPLQPSASRPRDDSPSGPQRAHQQEIQSQPGLATPQYRDNDASSRSPRQKAGAPFSTSLPNELKSSAIRQSTAQNASSQTQVSPPQLENPRQPGLAALKPNLITQNPLIPAICFSIKTEALRKATHSCVPPFHASN